MGMGLIVGMGLRDSHTVAASPPATPTTAWAGVTDTQTAS